MYTLGKCERLRSKKLIQLLFTEGISFIIYPIRVVWFRSVVLSDSPVQAGFSVLTRNFKKAVDRNLLKRRMREAYRINKQILYKELSVSNTKIILMFIYVGKDIPDFADIESKIILAIQRLTRDCEKVN